MLGFSQMWCAGLTGAGARVGTGAVASSSSLSLAGSDDSVGVGDEVAAAFAALIAASVWIVDGFCLSALASVMLSVHDSQRCRPVPTVACPCRPCRRPRILHSPCCTLRRIATNQLRSTAQPSLTDLLFFWGDIPPSLRDGTQYFTVLQLWMLPPDCVS